jgi:hypothetical protein
MRNISKLICLIGFLVFMVTSCCMTQTEVTQDGIDDHAQHLIHKRQANCNDCAGSGTGPGIRNLTNALIAPAALSSGQVICYVRYALAYNGACGCLSGARNLSVRNITNAPVVEGAMISFASSNCLSGASCSRYCYVPGILRYNAACGCYTCDK